MKHWRYLGYVLRHRWFVFIECLKLGLFWRGLTHDLSKFLPSEWFPYVEYFEGPRGVKACPKGQVPLDVREDFDRAWLKHLHRNKHHWLHWRLREEDGETTLVRMPDKYVREMLADWRGAGRAQGNASIRDWYAKNRDKIELHIDSFDRLRGLMTPEELSGRVPDPTSLEPCART